MRWAVTVAAVVLAGALGFALAEASRPIQWHGPLTGGPTR